VAIIILAGASYFLMHQSFTLGILLGGAIALINFDVMQSVISRAFSGGRTTKLKKIGLLLTFYLRFIGIAIICFFLLRHGWAHPVGLIIGLSTVVMGIVSFGVSHLFKTRTEEAT
jgi:hypothetical protein